MRTSVKWGCLVVVMLFVVAVVVAAIALHPYYAMPPESTAELDARMAEFQKVADEMQARPPADRQLLDALANDLYDVGRKVKEKPTTDACPAYDLKRLKELTPQMMVFLAFDERLHALADHGPVIQQDFGIESDLPNFSGVRNLAHWELAAAVIDIQEDRREDGLRRIHAVINLVGGMIQTPAILYAMIGVALEESVHQAVVYLLPQLTRTECAQIKEWLASLPDYRPSYLAAVKSEFAMQMAVIEQLRQRPAKKSAELLSMAYVVTNSPKSDLVDLVAKNLSSNKTLGGALVWLARNTGYFRREKYMMASIGSRVVSASEAWMNGPSGAPFDDTAIRKEIMCSPTAMIAVPNWGNLARKCMEAMQHRAAVVGALENVAGGKKTFELSYGSDGRLTVAPTHGCIVKNKTPMAASNN